MGKKFLTARIAFGCDAKRWRGIHFVAGVAIAGLLGPASGCKTALLFSPDNQTASTLEYKVLVDGREFTKSVAGGESFDKEWVGEFDQGSTLEVSASLPQGGRVYYEKRELPKQKKYEHKVTTKKILGEVIDLTDADDLEEVIVDLSGSFKSPVTFVKDLVEAAMGGVYVCTDTDNPVRPDCEVVYTPAELGSRQPLDKFISDPLPTELKKEMVLDRNAALKVGVSVKSIATVKVDFAASELYRYKLEFKNTGWRQSGMSWNRVEEKLKGSQQGRARLQKIVDTANALKQTQNQHLYYLNRSFTVGEVSVATYQARRLAIDADVTVKSYVAANAAFEISQNQYSSTSGKNMVVRVDYQEIRPTAGEVSTQSLRDKAQPLTQAVPARRYDMPPQEVDLQEAP